MNNVNNASLLPKALSTSYWKQKIAIMLQTQVSKHVLYAIYDQPFRSKVQSAPSTQDSYYHDLYPDSQVSVWDIVQNCAWKYICLLVCFFFFFFLVCLNR